MHEASIAQSLLDIVIETAQKNNALKINAVNLIIGKLSAVDTDALKTAYDVLKEDTIASESILNIKLIDIKGECLDCGFVSMYDTYYFKCKQCSSYNVIILEGEELSIQDIEVE